MSLWLFKLCEINVEFDLDLNTGHQIISLEKVNKTWKFYQLIFQFDFGLNCIWKELFYTCRFSNSLLSNLKIIFVYDDAKAISSFYENYQCKLHFVLLDWRLLQFDCLDVHMQVKVENKNWKVDVSSYPNSFWHSWSLFNAYYIQTRRSIT